ncbi:hypothetical protein [Caballeronia mineralivorans]|jgi:hypothetical protein|uniref:hypothetical protein n=1 Tax=Caballeronia mineralivorans TaxID=2010198 RepID=UPI0023F4C41D|nr:hypothetical protein [Caballeronia mineralivorans]MDB5785227.1 hypothetical protein [Caballeronia mineralivorans]MEA3097319.1 hypothetical protein [Caballeronia mineralivorans]
MTGIIVEDLPRDLTLDREAMACIHGGGGQNGQWVFGWMPAYPGPSQHSMGQVVNLYETNNNFYAAQMINQFQNIDVNNTGSNSNIAVNPNERSSNHSG